MDQISNPTELNLLQIPPLTQEEAKNYMSHRILVVPEDEVEEFGPKPVCLGLKRNQKKP